MELFHKLDHEDKQHYKKQELYLLSNLCHKLCNNIQNRLRYFHFNYYNKLDNIYLHLELMLYFLKNLIHINDLIWKSNCSLYSYLDFLHYL